MGTSNAKYTFTSVSIGSYGSQSDGVTPFGHALMENYLPLPPPVPLSDVSPEPFRHFFVGDAAFLLRSDLMCPY